MNNTKNDNSLDTAQGEVIWPYREGIWMNKESDPWICVIFVYLRLKEVPEAYTELEICHEKFLVELAPTIGAWARGQLDRTKRRGLRSAFKVPAFPYQSKELEEKVKSIFNTWVNKWALGSERMLQWLLACCILEDICIGCLGLSRRMLRSADGKPGKNLVTLASGLVSGVDKKLGWALELLLSPEYSRAEKAARKEARYRVRQPPAAFYRRRESTLAKAADYFVRTRILREKQLHRLAEEILGKEPRDLLRIIEPFDDALGWHRQPGAPLGTKHERIRRSTNGELITGEMP